jgi:hypothetical protein
MKLYFQMPFFINTLMQLLMIILRVIADHLKQAPHRSGGAGKGCHLVDADLSSASEPNTDEPDVENSDLADE